jgi:aspartate kinase
MSDGFGRTRRRFLAATGTVAASGLAGCSGLLGGNGSSGQPGLADFRGSGPLVSSRPAPGGTSIEGEFQNLIDLQEDQLSCVTVAGRAIRNSPGILGDLASAIGEEGINIDANSSGMDSLTFYVNSEDSDDVEALLHERVVEEDALSSVTVEDDIAVVRVTGGELPNQPDTVKRVVDPISNAHITLYDVITSATSVSVFVPWDDREQALQLVQGVF